jgi:hypothetical protein
MRILLEDRFHIESSIRDTLPITLRRINPQSCQGVLGVAFAIELDAHALSPITG